MVVAVELGHCSDGRALTDRVDKARINRMVATGTMSHRLLIVCLAALTLGTGLPGSACICADGSYKLHCSHGQPSASGWDRADLAAETDCCQATVGASCCDHDRSSYRRHAAQAASCDDASRQTGPSLTSRGCTPVSAAPAVAPAPESSQSSLDLAVASHQPTLDLPCLPAALHAAQPVPFDTGPPPDLVITLHCLLI